MNPEQIENIVRGIMENFPEASLSMHCVVRSYRTLEFHFDDCGTRHVTNLDMLVAAFPLIRSEKWPKGCTQPPELGTPEAWNDWLCQADATDFNAFLQLALFKEVIYG